MTNEEKDRAAEIKFNILLDTLVAIAQGNKVVRVIEIYEIDRKTITYRVVDTPRNTS